MRLTVLTVIIGGIAMLLLYGGITDRNPVLVIQKILQGEAIPPAGSWATPKIAKGKGIGDDAAPGGILV